MGWSGGQPAVCSVVAPALGQLMQIFRSEAVVEAVTDEEVVDEEVTDVIEEGGVELNELD